MAEFLAVVFLATAAAVGTSRTAFLARDHAEGNLEARAFAEAAWEFSGRIVWSSNRRGDHDIYLLDLRGRRPHFAQLTHDPHVDTHPRFSPDGGKILWNRSRDTRITEQRPVSWDVWIMNADGSAKRRLAEFGCHPSFTHDGRGVVFGREGLIVYVDLRDGSERVLLDSGAELGGVGQAPDLHGGLLALTVRGAEPAFGVYALGERRFTKFSGSGSMIAWWPEGDKLYWVQPKGRGGTRIVSGSPDGRVVETLVDLPGQYSHEYFPALSRDGDWLVFGAAAHAGEDDHENYDIFLWRTGSPVETAMRLTHDKGNDEWPDVFPEARGAAANILLSAGSER